MTPDDEIVEKLRKIEKHLDTLVRFEYAKIRKEAFLNPDDERVFELTGVKTRDEICSELHMSATTVSGLWNRWIDLGLIVRQGGGSYRKTVE